jgi:hypothetical protein
MEPDSRRSNIVLVSARVALRQVLQAPDSYGFVLALLIVSFILSPLVQGLNGLWVRVLVQGATMLFAVHTSRVHRLTMLLAYVLFAVSMVLALAAVITGGGKTSEGTLEVLIALLLAVAVPAILHRILTGDTVNGETIFGALDVYIIFGLFFSAVYAAIGVFSSSPFFGTHANVNSGSFQFFSFVTLTTVGYGNLVPSTQLGQSLAVVEALLGQVYLVTLVARLVGGFQRGTGRGAAERLAAERASRGTQGGEERRAAE